MLNFKEKLDLEKKDKIVLYRGSDDSGDFIAYLRCDKNQYMKVTEDSERGVGGHLHEYGQLLYLDYVAEPNMRAQQFLKEYLNSSQN